MSVSLVACNGESVCLVPIRQTLMAIINYRWIYPWVRACLYSVIIIVYMCVHFMWQSTYICSEPGVVHLRFCFIKNT